LVTPRNSVSARRLALRKPRLTRPVVLSGAALILISATAFAQTPQRTTATYGDWTVRCELRSAARTCDMVQTTEVKGGNRHLSQIAIGRPAQNTPLKIVFLVTVNVWLPAGIKLITADNVAAVTANFDRCIPAGCLAETDITAKTINTLHGLKKNGTLRYKNGDRNDVTLPVSFHGFGDDYDALSK
jgi:invasion protein IalB